MNIVRIDRRAIPEEEAEAATIVESNLLELQRMAQEFRSTYNLFQHAHGMKASGSDTFEMMRWIGIAGRNGAIVANGFAMGMETINSVRAPTLWKKADMEARKKATGLFAFEFPEMAGIRKSAAHPVELSGKPAKTAKHRLKKQSTGIGQSVFGPGTYVEGFMHVTDEGLTYSASFNGEAVSYELTDYRARVLERVSDLYCQTFYPLDPAGAAMREMLRGKSGPLGRD